MDFNFEDFKVQGIKFNYYFICKRKLWLFSKGISMESQSERVLEGKITHEYAYKSKEKKKEKLIDDMIKIDIFESDTIGEVKLSSKMKESDRMQLLYYLYYLNQIDIDKKGIINYVKERKVEKVELDELSKEKIEIALADIKGILNLKYPPKIEKFPYCKKCSYYEYCYVREIE